MNADRTCTVDECDRKKKSSLYCRMHWERMKRRGTTAKFDPQYPSIEESLRTRVREVGDCIEWTGARTAAGYGSLRVRRIGHLTHRLAWEAENGPILEGKVIDHICRNRACLKVDHLRLVTQAENMQNLAALSGTSKSGIRGVYWDDRVRKWQARVQANGKFHYGGLFDDKEEAGRVAAEMRARLMPFSQN